MNYLSIQKSSYDDSSETFTDYQKILLKDIEKIELGPESVSTQSFIFRPSSVPRFYVIRIHYKVTDIVFDATKPSINQSEQTVSTNGYFHTFRSCNLKFFNTSVITTKSSEELVEVLTGISHTITSTSTFFGYNINFEECSKLTK